MSDVARVLVSWIRDVLIAYAGGLALGAPVALAATRLTGRDEAATVSLLVAMVTLLIALRWRRVTPATTAPMAPPAVQRRAA